MTTKPTRYPVVIAAAFSLAVISFLPAYGQTTYSDTKLDAFARAVVSVSAMGDQWKARVNSAASTEEAESVKEGAREAIADMVDARSGITFEEYKAINAAMQNNPALIQRIQQALQKAS